MRNLWRSACLAMATLAFAACSQENSGIAEAPQSPSKNYQKLQLQLEAEATSERFDQDTPEPTAQGRSIVFDLGSEGAMTNPKFKELTPGTKLLCIIRSSNANQPINYIEAEWTKVDDRYVIRYTDGAFPFEYVAGQPLGKLYMMVIAGGQWDATSKQLSFSNRITPVTLEAGSYTATLDVPFISGWEELTIEEPTPDYLKAKLKGYKEGAATEPAFRLRPQGMLLRMRVENEMLSNNGKSRDVRLSTLYLRSTAYAGNGHYDLSESTLRSKASTPGVKNAGLVDWQFADANHFKSTTFALAQPLELPYDATRTMYDRTRGLYSYPNSPYLLAWVQPTGQGATDVGATTNGDYRVKTEILAHVEDTRSNTVYSNQTGVDQEEANGKIVVPSMKALPVYASRQLTLRNGLPSGFVNGRTYTLTLNLIRQPMTLDLTSEQAVNSAGTGFDDGSYSDIGYFRYAEVNSENGVATRLPLLGEKTNTNWTYPSFPMLATIMGFSGAVVGRIGSIDINDTRNRFPNVVPQGGTYGVEDGFQGSVQTSFTHMVNGENIIAYALLFYPRPGGNLTASHLALLRYEYDQDINGVPRMKITQRYLGPYSLAAANFNPGTATSAYPDHLTSDLSRLIALGSSFWDDNLLKQDDVVRYFPLLGYHNLQNGNALTGWGTEGYLAMGRQSDSNKGVSSFTRTYLGHTPHGTAPGKTFYENQIAVPIRAVRPNFVLP